ncbi:MAG: hypothetical protein Q9M27_04560 [Mariprofundaceae bacterium]|jgi:uncharacterized protein (DUF2345 family)|nr:hypothetical protein [Mariprofundaceae bacterium]
MDAKCFYHKKSEAASADRPIAAARQPARTARYDEQFTLLDDARRPLANVRYRIVVDGELVITGTTDVSGKTERVVTRGALSLELQVEN